MDTDPIAADLPVIDGSSSTRPLRMFIVCKLLEIQCGWTTWFDGSRRVLPNAGAPSDRINAAVQSSGTHGSYVALAEGRADLVIAARAPTEREIGLARESGLELEQRAVGRDGFVFLVHASNPVQSVSLDEVRAIFSGEITDWSQVGGEDRPIQPYQRGETSGSQVLMEGLVMRGRPMIDAPDMMLPTMMAPFDAVSRDPDGIGFSVFYYAAHVLLTDETRLLRIDGVEPTSETIRSGDYPLVTDVYAVLPASAGADQSSRRLFDWLDTDAGRETIQASGYVALP